MSGFLEAVSIFVNKTMLCWCKMKNAWLLS